MANQAQLESALSLIRRKQDLVAQGALLRSGLSSAQKVVKERLAAESLIRSTISQVAMAAFAVFKSRTGLTGAGLPTILPLLIGGVSALSRKALLKPVLRIGLGLFAVGAIITVMAKRKKNTALRRGEPGRG